MSNDVTSFHIKSSQIKLRYLPSSENHVEISCFHLLEVLHFDATFPFEMFGPCDEGLVLRRLRCFGPARGGAQWIDKTQGSLNYPFFGDQTMHMYGDF